MKKYVLILVFASFFIFLNSLNNDFIFDDEMLTVNSPAVVNGSFTDLLQTYRPIRFITYAFDYHCIGHEPWSFRIMNIFYHVLTTLSVFWFFLLLGLQKRNAFIGAFLFAIHPIHVDAVAYISGRRDVLTALFYVLSLSFFVKFYKSIKVKDKKSYFFLLLSIIIMFLSYFSKEMGATIPIAWLLIVYYFEQNKMFKTAWFWGMSMILFAVFAVAALYTIQRGGSSFVTLNSMQFHGRNPVTHYLTALTLPIYYIKQTVFPLQLLVDNIDYPLTTGFPIKLLFSVLGIVFYILIIAVLIKKAGKSNLKEFNKYSFYAFMLLFFILTLAPVLQIIPLHEIVAEHYLYLPSMAFCGIAGNIFGDAYEKLSEQNDKPKPFALLFMTLFLVCSIFFVWRTITRNNEMNNWFTIFEADSKIRPLSYRGLYTLATVYNSMKFPDTAYDYLMKSSQKAGGKYYIDDYYINLISYYGIKGLAKEAEQVYLNYPNKNNIPFSLNSMLGYIYIGVGRCDLVLEFLDKIKPVNFAEKRDFQGLKNCEAALEDLQKIEISLQACNNNNFCVAKNLNDANLPFQAVKFIIKAQKEQPENYVKILKEKINIFGKLALVSTLLKPDLRKIVKDDSISIDDRIYFLHELATLNLKTDIPEALKYYKLEKELRLKNGEQISNLLDKTIYLLENYIHEVLVEHKYFKLNF